MDDYVKSFLRQWELAELIPTFEDEEVNEKAFKCLTDDIIRELIPKLGKRAIFNNVYKTYREALETETPLGVVKQHDSLSESIFETTAPVKLESAIISPSNILLSENDMLFQVEKLPSQNVKLEPPEPDPPSIDAQDDEIPASSANYARDSDLEPPRLTFNISALETPSGEDLRAAESLRQLLNTSGKANHLLGKSFLTRSSRNVLAAEIVDYLYAANKGVLSNCQLQSWARAVELVFNEEINGLYFRETEDGSACGGKLAQYYRQLKQMKEAGRETM